MVEICFVAASLLSSGTSTIQFASRNALGGLSLWAAQTARRMRL